LWKRFELEGVTRGSLLLLQEGFGVHIQRAEALTKYEKLRQGVYERSSMSRRDFLEVRDVKEEERNA
jgi:hypothetical protein